MAKKPTLEARLAGLRALDPTAPDAIVALRAALADTWLLAAAAADLAREHLLDVLADDLVAAYPRLATGKADPTFAARVAIVRALDALSRWDDAVFAAGVATRAYVPEPATEDDAAALRSACGLAYVAAGRDDALDVLATLLADRAESVRAHAARGLGATGMPGASALLRYKLAAGDRVPDVIQALVEALLDLQRERAIELLVPMLDDQHSAPAYGGAARSGKAGPFDADARAEVIALALGAARATEAFEALCRWSNACTPATRARVGFLPLALLRDDRANAWLAERIGDHKHDALAAAKALVTFAVDPAIATLVRQAAVTQKDPATRSAILALLGD